MMEGKIMKGNLWNKIEWDGMCFNEIEWDGLEMEWDALR